MKRPAAPPVAQQPATVRARPSFPARLSSTVPAQPVRTSASSSPLPTVTQPAMVMPGRDPSSGTGGAQALRLAMVQKLQRQGLSHPAVLAAMQAVERHRFVDTALANQAYEDTSLPIGLGQTISKPNVVARMLELLCEGREDRLGRVLTCPFRFSAVKKPVFPSSSHFFLATSTGFPFFFIPSMLPSMAAS